VVEGEAVVVVSVVVLVVVSGEAVGLAVGETVSVFCSQAASSAAPAKMQMYFFIILSRGCDTQLNPISGQDDISVAKIGLKKVDRISFHAPQRLLDTSIFRHGY
jgi:hypothetical protein